MHVESRDGHSRCAHGGELAAAGHETATDQVTTNGAPKAERLSDIMTNDLQQCTIRKAVPNDHGVLTALAHRAKANWDYPATWIAQWKPALTITPEYIAQHCVE